MAVLDFNSLDEDSFNCIATFISCPHFPQYLGDKSIVIVDDNLFEANIDIILNNAEANKNETANAINKIHRNALTPLARNFLRRIATNNTFLWSLADVYRCGDFIEKRYKKCGDKLINPEIMDLLGKEQAIKAFESELGKYTNLSMTYLLHVLLETVERKNLLVKIAEKIKLERKKKVTHPANGKLFVSPSISSLIYSSIPNDIDNTLKERIKKTGYQCDEANGNSHKEVTLSRETLNELHKFSLNKGITLDEALLFLL